MIKSVQCGHLSNKDVLLTTDDDNKARISALNLLVQHGVYEEYVELFLQTYPGLTKANDGLKDKDKEKAKEKKKERLPLGDTDMEQDSVESESPLGEQSTDQSLPWTVIDEESKKAFQEARNNH